MGVNITFWTGNDAFAGNAGPIEVHRILKDIGARILLEHTSGTILDCNGNTVGDWYCLLPKQEVEEEEKGLEGAP